MRSASPAGDVDAVGVALLPTVDDPDTATFDTATFAATRPLPEGFDAIDPADSADGVAGLGPDDRVDPLGRFDGLDALDPPTDWARATSPGGAPVLPGPAVSNGPSAEARALASKVAKRIGAAASPTGARAVPPRAPPPADWPWSSLGLAVGRLVVGVALLYGVASWLGNTAEVAARSAPAVMADSVRPARGQADIERATEPD